MIPSASRVAALVEERYPGRDVMVKPVDGGLQIEVRGNGSSIIAIVGDHEHSVILAAFTGISGD